MRVGDASRLYGLLRSDRLEGIIPDTAPEGWDHYTAAKIAFRGPVLKIEVDAMRRHQTATEDYRRMIHKQERGWLGRMTFARHVLKLCRKDPEMKAARVAGQLAMASYFTKHTGHGFLLYQTCGDEPSRWAIALSGARDVDPAGFRNWRRRMDTSLSDFNDRHAGPCGIIRAGGKSVKFSGAQGNHKALALVDETALLLHAAASLVCGGAEKIVVPTGSNHNKLREGLQLTGAGDRVFGILSVTPKEKPAKQVPFELRFTGDSAGTAGRLAHVSEQEIGDLALLSYTDVLSDSDFAGLQSAVRDGADVTVMAVHPPLPFGVMQVDDQDSVTEFREKALGTDLWINGGVMAINATILKEISSPAEMLKEQIMEELTAQRRVRVFKHMGHWYAVNTQKDFRQLQQSLASENGDWEKWSRVVIEPA